MNAESSSIRVTVRVRPLSSRELAQLAPPEEAGVLVGEGSLSSTPSRDRLGTRGLHKIVRILDERVLVFDPPEDNPIARFQKTLLPAGKRVKDMRYAFDHIFDEDASQQEVFLHTCKPLLDSVLEGFNSTVFAYGATGCGKTHTISGTPEHPGIIFLTMEDLFGRIKTMRDTKTIDVSLSYLEIYNEMIKDLLEPGKPLMLREDEFKKIGVAGLSVHTPKDVHHVMQLILNGNANRTISSTEANATSSRSHAILQVNLTQKDRTADVSEETTMATLSIIDLAGSERASVTKNRGDRLIEGANINRSLLALGNCINALCDPHRRNHIPYRDSKLTRLLKFSLGGNCKTVMIVCVSPSSAHYDETHNTLKYGNRAKEIKTKISRNMLNIDRHVSGYVKAIYELRQEVAELKQKLKSRQTEIDENRERTRQAHQHLVNEAVQSLQTSAERYKVALTELGIKKAESLLCADSIKFVETWLSGPNLTMNLGLSSEEEKSIKSLADGLLVELRRQIQKLGEKIRQLSSNNYFITQVQAVKRLVTSNQLHENSRILIDSEIKRLDASLASTISDAELVRLNQDFIAQNKKEQNLFEIDGIEDWLPQISDFPVETPAAKLLLALLKSKLDHRMSKPDCSSSSNRHYGEGPITRLNNNSTSPYKSPRPFKVKTPRKNVLFVKRMSPVKKHVRWEDQNSGGSLQSMLDVSQNVNKTTFEPNMDELEKSMTSERLSNEPIRKSLMDPTLLSRQFSRTILSEANGMSDLPNNYAPGENVALATEGAQDASFTTVSSAADSSPLISGQDASERSSFKRSSSLDNDSPRQTRRKTSANGIGANVSPKGSKRSYKKGKENSLVPHRRPSEVPNSGARRMTLLGSSVRVQNPTLGSGDSRESLDANPFRVSTANRRLTSITKPPVRTWR